MSGSGGPGAMAAAIQRQAVISASQEEALAGVAGWEQPAGALMDETPSQPGPLAATAEPNEHSSAAEDEQRVFDVTASTTLSEPSLEPVEWASPPAQDGDSFDAAFESDRSRSPSRRLSWGLAAPASPASASASASATERRDEGEEASALRADSAARRGECQLPLPEPLALEEGAMLGLAPAPAVQSGSAGASETAAGAKEGPGAESGEETLLQHCRGVQRGGAEAETEHPPRPACDTAAGFAMPCSPAVERAPGAPSRPPRAVQEKLDRLRSHGRKRICRETAEDLAIVREGLWKNAASRSQDPCLLPDAVMDAIRASSGPAASGGTGAELLDCALREGVSLPPPFHRDYFRG